MPKIAIPDPRCPTFSSQDRAFKEHFGLDRKQKWPAEGIEDPIYVRGDYGTVALWVNAIPASGNPRHQHRLHARCGICGDVMSAGRLQQHCAKVHA